MLEGVGNKLRKMALTRGQAHDLVRMQCPLESLSFYETKRGVALLGLLIAKDSLMASMT